MEVEETLEARGTEVKRSESLTESPTDTDENIVTEHGVHVLQRSPKSVAEKHRVYNPRMKIIREAVLCVLKQQIVERTNNSRLNCADVMGGSGISGLQWKKHFGDSVNVSIADISLTPQIKSNCVRSGLIPRDLDLNLDQIAGDQKLGQEANELHVVCCAPKVLLHLEAYDFVYLNPEGNITGYLDAVFSNLRNQGILCVAASEISHLFVRSSQAVKRYYSASVIKTDYTKELAVRVVLGAIARSAARCNKGIDCLLSMCVDDFFFIVTRVVRGTKSANFCCEKVCPLIHCQMCDERAFYPNSLSPVEEPYSILRCDCKDNTPGKTAVLLGPMWSGDIFNTDFVTGLIQHSKDLKVCEKLQTVFTSIKEESLCPKENSSELNTESHNGEPPHKKQKCTEDKGKTSEDNRVTMPPFFYDLHRRKLKGVELPKSSRLLTLLRCEGHRASRTHFDANAIRTSATLKQLYSVLLKCCSKNQ